MCALEVRAQPFLRPLIANNTPCTISEAGQAAIATWAAKTAMVFEAFRVDDDWFYSDSDREYVRRQARPPKRTSVWLAHYTGAGLAFSEALDLGGTLQDGRRFSAHVTTFTFGRLAIQISSGNLPEDIPETAIVDLDVKPGPWENATIRAWPRNGVEIQWPPTVAVQDDGVSSLDLFSDRWGAD